MELHLQILRHILIAKDPTIYLWSVGYSEISGFGFGSLGILRVSKYWSALALSVLYRENTFAVAAGPFDVVIESNKASRILGNIQ